MTGKPEQETTSKPKRVLACVLCQQRKIKCNREFPCANCLKADAQCVPGSWISKQRRPRFPERKLLERLRHYEGLLRQNNVAFEPLHPQSASKDDEESASVGESTPAQEPSLTHEDRRREATRNEEAGQDKSAPETQVDNGFWRAMNNAMQQKTQDDESDSSTDLRENVFKKAWTSVSNSHGNLVFGPRKTSIDLSTLHPQQVQIFRLWQLYLENVNPLLKITHTPTLQARIIDAASNLATVDHSLEALMFGIYCLTVSSLTDDACRTLFTSPKRDLLKHYQFSCQQALLNCGVMRYGDLDSLAALLLYLLSGKPDTDPQTLNSMFGVAVRVAQRMGIDNEATYARYTPLEAETRRRLWWCLVVFDTRIREMSNFKGVVQSQVGDCEVPHNIDDSDLRPEMKTPPSVHGKTSEALFAVVRSKMTRHLLRRETAADSDWLGLETAIENDHLRYCNPDNSLHFMTLWTARGQFAKARLMGYYSTPSSEESAVVHAQTFLECDTKLMTSPLTKRFLWVTQLYFPFIAYVTLIQSLQKQPANPNAGQYWQIMSRNWEARFKNTELRDHVLMESFSRVVLQVWEAREAEIGYVERPPWMISNIRSQFEQMNRDELPSFAAYGGFFDISEQALMDFDMDCTAVEWIPTCNTMW